MAANTVGNVRTRLELTSNLSYRDEAVLQALIDERDALLDIVNRKPILWSSRVLYYLLEVPMAVIVILMTPALLMTMVCMKCAKFIEYLQEELK